MSIPKIVEHSIVVMKKPGGLKQYIITLPKEYAASLDKKGIRKLLIVYNHGLAAFPNMGEETEAMILEYLKAHPDLMKTFVKPGKKEALT